MPFLLSVQGRGCGLSSAAELYKGAANILAAEGYLGAPPVCPLARSKPRTIPKPKPSLVEPRCRSRFCCRYTGRQNELFLRLGKLFPESSPCLPGQLGTGQQGRYTRGTLIKQFT